MILVTGGAGYVGSHFIKRYLAAQTQSLVVVDNLSAGHTASVVNQSGAIFQQGDIGDREFINALLAKYKIETVVHFAASAYVGESQQNPNKYFHNNVVNTLNLLAAMEENQVRKMVFSSTCAIYGNPEYVPLDENHPQQPINIYGLTKFMVEKALSGYAAAAGWSYIALRYFNASGADDTGTIGESHEPETHLIPLALQAALGKSVLNIYGDDYDTPDGTCIRDYIHVNDLADAHCQALKILEQQKGGDAINLGTTYGASVKEVVETCQEVTGRSIPFKLAARRPGDPPRLVANADKAAKVLGWKPQYDLRKTVETAWNWEQNRQF
jgi:UDP-glucose 4-epimerase